MSKGGVRQFTRPSTGSSFLQGDKIQEVIKNLQESSSPSSTSSRTSLSLSRASTSPSPGVIRPPPITPRISRTTPPPTGTRKPSLPSNPTSQEIFNRISTSSVNYSMRPAVPARPSFTRLGAERYRLSSGEDSSDQVDAEEPDSQKVNMVHDDGQSDTCSSNHLSLTFSEVDDTDSAAEAETVKLENEVEKVDPEKKVSKTKVQEEEKSVKPFYTKPSLCTTPYKPSPSISKDSNIKSTVTSQPFQKSLSSDKLKLNPVQPPVIRLHHKPLTPGGFVGFANLPDQVYRKSLRKGFEFSLMVVGESGLGKSTLVNSMFLTDIYSSKENQTCPVGRTVKVENHHVVLEEGGVKLSLNVVDTPGFGDGVDNSDCWDPITEYVDKQFNKFLEAETQVNRVHLPDTRIHACLYFIAPSGHGLRSIDVEFMRRLHDKVNIIPVIGKSDACTKEELALFKKKILKQLEESNISVYEFPSDETNPEDNLVPFAVVGSNVVVQDESGKRVRGRKYPWGTVNIEDKNHCDFLALRSLVLAHHMQDLKDVTGQVHYEKYRCTKLTELAISNEGAMLNKNPLAVIEDEKNGHQEKLRKMTNDMEDVFKRKVEEKQEKMNKVEREDMERLEKEKKHLEEEKIRLASKKEELESDKKSWAQTHGIEMAKFLHRSTESLDGKKKKYGLSVNPFKFGRS
eukprot:TRINITY_DN37948_c0_g1_i9.p1 TRINITY_DN37948_c0_g1~~TRINITY_DN37948_c0_g1_i9.p1  ORF type:complete len:683 (-),score=230.28 TRINITY_DN37948_c0_g1_i9:149-2197(-)